MERRPGTEQVTDDAAASDARPVLRDGDPLGALERYPADEAEENIGYQKLAWYAAPFADAGVALLVLAFIANALRRAGRALIRLLLR